MNKTLLQEAKKTREDFIIAVNKCSWDREARTAAEGLIIIYDQLVEMIEKTDIIVSIPSIGLFTCSKLNADK